MDKFSHDLAVALEETSLLDRAHVSRWGRRRTRSTGNLPSAPQPTEDSSSSPTDVANSSHTNATKADGLVSNTVAQQHSDSDEKEETKRLPCKSLNALMRVGALESDSLNEAFSPARFFKPSTRKKRKLKRMSLEYESVAKNDLFDTTLVMGTNTTTLVRKRVLKPDSTSRSKIFYCGKRKRSNRDRYQSYENDQSKTHSSSMPRHSYLDEYRTRPRSFSFTSKPQTDRLLPLNKGLLSKIEKISQLQKTENQTNACEAANEIAVQMETMACVAETTTIMLPLQQTQETQNFHSNQRKKENRLRNQTQLQFAVDQHPMDCIDLNDFLSSSSLSSSESDDVHSENDTDREGDDELTDWPGNEAVNGLADAKYDPKRKFTKKSNLAQIKSDEGGNTMMTEEDTLMLGSGNEWPAFDSPEPSERRYQASQPITITTNRIERNTNVEVNVSQIESEMSGETSNPFLQSSPCLPSEVREIRAGCRRVKTERPGFSIKTSVNERLARFLQDPKQTQIRLPDIEIYEHESLINLAELYSLKMSLENGSAVLIKTSNTTQSVNIDHQSLQSRIFLSDFKRRCYDSNKSLLPRK